MNTANSIAHAVCACGKSFEVRAGGGRKRKHCSDNCREAARLPKVWVTLGERRLECAYCGVAFMASHKRKYCAPLCRSKADFKREREARAELHRARATTVCCAGCDAEFCPMPGLNTMPSHCHLCSALLDETHWQRIRNKRIRAARVEPVDRLRVFERDKWTCRICGDKTVRKPYMPNSAELDHIQPIARGGEHSYLNTQCACRKCNLLKGAKALGQMLLVG